VSDLLNLETVDRDGAIREAAERVSGDTRLSFLRKAGLGAGALMGGGAMLSALAPSALAAGSGRPPASFGAGDIGILNYALTLEYLESSFYNQAYTHLYTTASPALKAYLSTTKTDEADHVAALKGALGAKAIKKPKFDFGNAVSNLRTFEATAYVLENTGVAAYSGQAFNITEPKILGVALSIVTVEARHAGAIASITGMPIAKNGPFDIPQTATQILAAVTATKFITS
jgi:Ferritin-like domain